MERLMNQVKRGSKYVTVREYTEVLHRDYIHSSLAEALLNHYVEKKHDIMRITERHDKVDGFIMRIVTVYYDNGKRRVYEIEC